MTDFPSPERRLADLRMVTEEFRPSLPPASQGGLRLRFGAQALEALAARTVVRGVLHEQSVTLIYGPPKSGKSFLATDLALAVTTGDRDWMGHQVTKPGPVLYVACEGEAGFWKRLKAMKKQRGWTDAQFPRGFILATGRPTLLRSDLDGRSFAPDPSAILQAIDEASAHGIRPVAVIIDTVFRSVGGGNVNSSEHMNAYIAALDGIASLGLAVAIIHHEAKAGGSPAGSVTLMGAADTILHVWRNKPGDRFWQVEMAKDDAETEPKCFRLDVVSVGPDPEGHDASSCVVVPAEPSAPAAEQGQSRKPKLPEQARIALRCLAEVINAEGLPLPAGDGFPLDKRGVSDAVWRRACQRRDLSNGGDRAMRDAFKRARDKLQASQQAATLDGWWWLP